MKFIDRFTCMSTSLLNLTDNLSDKFMKKNVIIVNAFMNKKKLKIIYCYLIV